jgi:hypothetical protein
MFVSPLPPMMINRDWWEYAQANNMVGLAASGSGHLWALAGGGRAPEWHSRQMRAHRRSPRSGRGGRVVAGRTISVSPKPSKYNQDSCRFFYS